MSRSKIQIWLWVILKESLRFLMYLIGVFCLIGVAFSVLGVIDPKDAKLADDSDPFGDPGTRWDAGKMLLIYLLVSMVGFYTAKKLRGSRQGTEANYAIKPTPELYLRSNRSCGRRGLMRRGASTGTFRESR